jgi:hypothetical protein
LLTADSIGPENTQSEIYDLINLLRLPTEQGITTKM